MTPRLSRLERMTNLVLVLLETSRPISLREIGSMVAGYPSGPGPLRQAFERDKRTLRDGGIPITVERIDGEEQVGYTIVPEEYYLPDLGLSDAETEAIGFALAAVALEGAPGSDVAEKLGAERPDIPPLAVLPALEALGPLHEAIRQRAVAHFTYHGRPREIEGESLQFSGGFWYVSGRDRTTEPPGQPRTFRVDRIESVVEIGSAWAYSPSDGAVVDGTDLEREPEVVAKILVDRRHAPSFPGRRGWGRVVERSPDGSEVLEVPVGDPGAVVSFVLGLGDGAEILEPPELRQRIVAALEEAER